MLEKKGEKEARLLDNVGEEKVVGDAEGETMVFIFSSKTNTETRTLYPFAGCPLSLPTPTSRIAKDMFVKENLC